jgi:archaellum component FlaC
MEKTTEYYQDQAQDKEIDTLKDRTKDLESHWVVLNSEFGFIKQDMATVKNDVTWIKKALDDMKQSHWLIVGASITALLTAITDIVIRLIFK